MSETARIVKTRAEELGFALCGVAPAAPSAHVRELIDWVAAGKHGEMHYLAEHIEQRLDPRKLVASAESIICVADQIPTEPPAATGPREGRIAAYARIDDYHKVLKRRLFRLADRLRSQWPAHVYRPCVDTAPVLEREHAMRAGIGWVGKNTLILNRHRGSHLLLGEIVTTLHIPPDTPETDHCGTCRRCIDACPTDCITPYSVDASRCISYWTIEHRSAIDPAHHEAMGDWLFGCDVCQEVCPFNHDPQNGSVPDRDGRRPATMDLLEVLDWGEEDRRAAFVRSAMKRAKLPQMKRNALIVAANKMRDTADPVLAARIESIARDTREPDVVRRTAWDVLTVLRAGDAQNAQWWK